MDEALVKYGENAQETATLLLGAAEDLGYEAYVVRHQPDDGGFRAPQDVVDKAGVGQEKADTDDADDAADGDDADEAPAAEKLTPKQQSMKTAEDLGLSTKGTKAEIDKRIAAKNKK